MFDAVMNFGLGEEIDALRETVRRFAVDEIAPRAAPHRRPGLLHDQSGSFAAGQDRRA